MLAAPTPISIRRPATNSRPRPALPTISRIQTRNIEGIDFHFDWGAAHFLTKQLFVGLAGYGYQQLTDDSGQNPILGGFRSRVLGVGPQIGYAFPVGDMQGFVGLRAYGDFDAANRAPGWSTWLTLAISPAAPAAVTPTKHLLTK